MKKYISRFLALISIVAIVTSCTGVTLSRLQSDFDQLYQKKLNCPEEPTVPQDITKIGSLTCIDESEAALFSLAESANSSATKASDQRTKVALLRLAGVSLWQSGRGAEANDWTYKIYQEGDSVCTPLEAKAKKGEIYGAPRDCALLTILPALVWHSEYIERLERLKYQDPTNERKQTLKEIIQNYHQNTVGFISEKENKAKNFTGISESIKEYIDEVKKRSYCNFLRAEEIVLKHDIYRVELKQEVKEKIRIMSEKVDLDRRICR